MCPPSVAPIEEREREKLYERKGKKYNAKADVDEENAANAAWRKVQGKLETIILEN